VVFCRLEIFLFFFKEKCGGFFVKLLFYKLIFTTLSKALIILIKSIKKSSHAIDEQRGCRRDQRWCETSSFFFFQSFFFSSIGARVRLFHVFLVRVSWVGGFGFGEKFNDFSRFRRVRVFINLCNDDCD
jgi:hypothetical protein